MLITNKKKKKLRVSRCFSQQNKTAQQFLHNSTTIFTTTHCAEFYTLFSHKILHNCTAHTTTQLHTCCSSLCLRARPYTPGTKSADTKGPCGPVLGASAQAVKECGCRGEAAKTPRWAKKKHSGAGAWYTWSARSNMLTEHTCMAIIYVRVYKYASLNTRIHAYAVN